MLLIYNIYIYIYYIYIIYILFKIIIIYYMTNIQRLFSRVVNILHLFPDEKVPDIFPLHG